DTYIVGQGDFVSEAADSGIDTVFASTDYVLGDTLEHLTLTGSGATSGVGNAQANRLAGNGASNTLSGLSGNDSIRGEGGADVIIGGLGTDTLAGGAGSDTFRFDSVADSMVGASDLIVDFANGDRLDLSGIDAHTSTSGDQAFTQVSAFSGDAGQMTLTYNADMNRTTLSLDVDGDGMADSAIQFIGNVSSTDGWML
ncbi:MAG: type I secretion target, partial [Caulobacteraceae bacterium]